jgi:hypothetical protein
VRPNCGGLAKADLLDALMLALFGEKSHRKIQLTTKPSDTQRLAP